MRSIVWTILFVFGVHYTLLSFVPNETISSDKKKLEQLFDEVKHAMNIDQCLLIIDNPTLTHGVACAYGYKNPPLIAVDSKRFNQLDDEAKKFIFAHELQHVIQIKSLMIGKIRVLNKLVRLFAKSASIVLLASKVIHCGEEVDNLFKWSDWQQVAQKIARTSTNDVLPLTILWLGTALTDTIIASSNERDADEQAAHLYAQGGVRLFDWMIHEDQKVLQKIKSESRIAYVILKILMPLIRLTDSHQSHKARKKYCKRILSQQQVRVIE